MIGESWSFLQKRLLNKYIWWDFDTVLKTFDLERGHFSSSTNSFFPHSAVVSNTINFSNRPRFNKLYKIYNRFNPKLKIEVLWWKKCNINNNTYSENFWLYTTTYTLSLWLCFIVVFEAEHGMDKRQKIMLFHYPGC